MGREELFARLEVTPPRGRSFWARVLLQPGHIPRPDEDSGWPGHRRTAGMGTGNAGKRDGHLGNCFASDPSLVHTVPAGRQLSLSGAAYPLQMAPSACQHVLYEASELSREEQKSFLCINFQFISQHQQSRCIQDSGAGGMTCRLVPFSGLESRVLAQYMAEPSRPHGFPGDCRFKADGALGIAWPVLA